MEEGLSVYTDGGARGNPGPGACAFVIKKGGEVLAAGSKFLGQVTNNYAEYSGVVLALEQLVKNGISGPEKYPINFYLDSELVTKQLRREYRIKNPSLKKLADVVFGLISQNNMQIVFKHVPRASNKVADSLVNQELDKRSAL